MNELGSIAGRIQNELAEAKLSSERALGQAFLYLEQPRGVA
jgi:hypothetical protein